LPEVQVLEREVRANLVYRDFTHVGGAKIPDAKTLRRCRYKGYIGMKRWVGLGIIADNIVNIGRAMEKRAAP
jgi:hypothetical protein